MPCRLALLAVVLAMTVDVVVGAHPLQNGVPEPGEIHWSNPAVRPLAGARGSLLAVRAARSGSFHLPLGLAGLLALPDRSPLYPLLAGDWSRIDFSRSLLQLRYPTALVVNPPSAPEELVIEVSARGVELPIADSWAAQPVASDTARGPTVAPSFLPVFRRTAGLFEMDLGFGVSAGYPRVSLSSSTLGANDEVTGSVDLYGDFSVALSSRVVAEQLQQNGDRLRVALRAYVPVSLAHTRARAGVSVQSGDLALPASAGYEWSAEGWYPGQGVGAGLRLDLGVAWERAPWVVGLGANGLPAVFAGEGVRLDRSDERATVSYAPGLPVPTATVRLETRRLSAALDARYDDRLRARIGGRFLPESRIHLLAGVGWSGVVTGAVGVVFVIGPFRTEVGLRLLEPVPGSANGGFVPLGVTLSVGGSGGTR